MHTHTHALLKDFTPTSGRSLPRAPLPQAEKTKKEKRTKKRKRGSKKRKEGRKEEVEPPGRGPPPGGQAVVGTVGRQ